MCFSCERVNQLFLTVLQLIDNTLVTYEAVPYPSDPNIQQLKARKEELGNTLANHLNRSAQYKYTTHQRILSCNCPSYTQWHTEHTGQFDAVINLYLFPFKPSTSRQTALFPIFARPNRAVRCQWFCCTVWTTLQYFMVFSIYQGWKLTQAVLPPVGYFCVALNEF